MGSVGPDSLIEYAAENLADSQLPNIETAEKPRLLEAMISDLTKTPSGICLAEIQ